MFLSRFSSTAKLLVFSLTCFLFEIQNCESFAYAGLIEPTFGGDLKMPLPAQTRGLLS